MNLYLKFEKNNWYDFGSDDRNIVFSRTNKKEQQRKKWINDALETISRFAQPFGTF